MLPFTQTPLSLYAVDRPPGEKFSDEDPNENLPAWSWTQSYKACTIYVKSLNTASLMQYNFCYKNFAENLNYGFAQNFMGFKWSYWTLKSV